MIKVNVRDDYDNEAIKSRPKGRPKTTLLQDILWLLLKIVVMLLVLVLLFTFVFGIHRVTDQSMSPAIREGDLVIYYRLDKDFVASDVLVAKLEEETQVRRVVASEGDSVDISEDGLLINGSLIQEADISEETLPFVEGIEYPQHIKESYVFVLGDNRTKAVDSRLYGGVPIRETLGKVIGVIRRRNI